MTAPRLSVVIPAWNRASVVGDAIASALAQGSGVEVIVVDDASTDDTARLVKERFGASVRLLRLPRRRGPGAARNAGAAKARGEWLAFLDSDDLWLPGKFDAELALLEQFPGADAVISDSREVEGITRFQRNGLLAACGRQPRWLDDCAWLWTNSTNGVATCAITVRRDRLAGRPLFAEDLETCEDWEFEMRVYRTCRTVVLPRVFAEIRRFDDGTRAGRHERRLLRDRLTVIERAQWLGDLPPDLAAELCRFHDETRARLAQMEGV